MNFDASAYVNVGIWEPIDDDDDDGEDEQANQQPPSSLPGPGPQPEKSKADLRQTKTFRKIEQHLKVRKKNAAMDTGVLDPRMEIYVDKDRAIAVVSGAEDLKGHVMKLRGDMMRSTRNCELEALGIQVIIEQAAHELKYGDPRKSLSYLERGILIRPDSIDCLVLKSRCLLEMNRYREAMEDADKILFGLKDPNNPKALTVKGDALYNMGNFEHALLNYHRAIRNSSTKERDDLRLRVTRTEIAVCNAVGPNASRYFKNLEKFLNKIPNNIMGLPWFQLKTVVDTEAPERFKQSKTKDRKFLSEMASDKHYLEKILNRLSEQKNTQSKCHNKVKKQAQEALNFLIERRDFWAQQNPDYPEDPMTDEPVEPTSWKSMVARTIQQKTARENSAIGFEELG